MKKILIFLLLLLLGNSAYGAFPDDIVTNRGQMFQLGIYDPFLTWAVATEAIVDSTAGTATASKAVVLDASSRIDVMNVGTSGVTFLESAGATFTTTIKGGDQGGNLTLTLPTIAATTGYFLSSTDAGILSWAAAGSGTFTGGSITGDMTLSDDVDIFSTTTITDTSSIGVRDVDAGAYIDVLRWTNANTPTIVLGHANASFALASTGVDISTAGAITNVTSLTASGTVGAGTVTTGILTTTGVVTLGNDTAALSIASTGIDISSAGAITDAADITLTGDVFMSDGKGVKSTTTTAHTVGVYGYDVGAGYVAALEVTNSATPATVLGNTSGTTAISSSDWTISTAGNAANLGTIGSDGLYTGTGGMTLSGTVSINDAATTATTSIGAGNTTGVIGIGTGAAAKTVSIGSSNSTSTTTLLGGSNGINLNVGTFDDPTNINTGLNTGTVTIGGTGAMSIAIGDGGTGAKTITIGDAASTGSTVIKAGTGNLDLSAVDDVSLNGGSSGSIIGVGQNTHGNVIRVGQDDTTADTITIGSAKDTSVLAGISVTIGSTGTTSATEIQSGSGEVKINESINQPVSIGTGTSTGTIEIGNGDTAQTVTIANGAGVKTVALGSTNSTSITTISGGSAGLALNGPVAINTSKTTNTTAIGAGTTTGAITIGGTGTQTVNVGNGVGIKTVNVGSITTSSATVISSGTGDLDIISTAILDIDVGTTLDILVSGAFSFDGANAASNISLATNNAADDFTLAVTGGTDSSLVLTSDGTGSDAVYIHASDATGGVTIDAGTDGVTFSDADVSNIGTLSCDEISDDASPNITYQVKTVTITIGETGGSSEDFQWGAGAGHAPQNVNLGAIVPAFARIFDATVICTETAAGGAQSDFPTTLGNQSGGTEFFGAVDLVTANLVASGAAAGSPYIAVSASAQSVWIGADPTDGVWNNMTAGIWSVMITYVDNDAAKDN